MMHFFMFTFPAFATQHFLGVLADGSDVVYLVTFSALAQRVPSSISAFNDPPSRRRTNAAHIGTLLSEHPHVAFVLVSVRRGTGLNAICPLRSLTGAGRPFERQLSLLRKQHNIQTCPMT